MAVTKQADENLFKGLAEVEEKEEINCKIPSSVYIKFKQYAFYKRFIRCMTLFSKYVSKFQVFKKTVQKISNTMLIFFWGLMKYIGKRLKIKLQNYLLHWSSCDGEKGYSFRVHFNITLAFVCPR